MHYNNSISKQPGGDNGYREARGRWPGGGADALRPVDSTHAQYCTT